MKYVMQFVLGFSTLPLMILVLIGSVQLAAYFSDEKTPTTENIPFFFVGLFFLVFVTISGTIIFAGRR